MYLIWKSCEKHPKGVFSPKIELHFYSLCSPESCCLNCINTLWETIRIFRNLHHRWRRTKWSWLKGRDGSWGTNKITSKLQLMQKSIQGQNMEPPATTFTTKFHFPFIFCSLNRLQSNQIWILHGYIQKAWFCPGWPEEPDPFWRLSWACVLVVWMMFSMETCIAMNNTGQRVDLMEIFWQVYMTKHRILSKQLFPMRRL